MFAMMDSDLLYLLNVSSDHRTNKWYDNNPVHSLCKEKHGSTKQNYLEGVNRCPTKQKVCLFTSCWPLPGGLASAVIIILHLFTNWIKSEMVTTIYHILYTQQPVTDREMFAHFPNKATIFVHAHRGPIQHSTSPLRKANNCK